jgi:uncharacterized protein (TIGR02996 family)
MARNAELEAALIADPDDRATYAVYADWLESQGDLRAELMHVQLHADERTPEQWELVRAAIARLESVLLGELVQRMSSRRYRAQDAIAWRLGFIDAMRLRNYHVAEPYAPLVADLLAHPSAALLRELEVDAYRDATGEIVDTDADEIADVVAVLVRVTPRSLRQLRLRLARDVATLPDLVTLPNLEHLRLDLVNYDRCMSPDTVRAVATAPWPRLRRIGIDVGRDGAMPLDLAPLFERTDLPLAGLSVSGDRRSTFCTAICRMLVASPHAATLERISLSVGNLALADYQLLLENRWRFPRVRTFDVPSPSHAKLLTSPPAG